jgi:hypothetical protein
MENIYLVFRKYKKTERPNSERSVLYGWTKSSYVMKAFLSQRDNKKYEVIKREYDDIKSEIPHINYELLVPDKMIDYTIIEVAATGERIPLFMTAVEMNETEKKIQRMFHDLSSVAKIPGKANYVDMIINLDPFYRIPLFFVGYRPEEIDILYPSADDSDNIAPIDYIEQCIDDAYEEVGDPTDDNQERYHYLPGAMGLDDTQVSSKVVYSLESFVKVMADDL